MQKKIAIIFALIIASAGVAAGTSAYLIASEPSPPLGPDQMPTFSSYAELADFLDGAKGQNDYANSTYGAPSSSGQNALLDKQGASSPDYSRTNVQVQGIDEADIVKTDGQYLYISSWNSVAIIRAYPPSELSAVSYINSSDLTGYFNSTLRQNSNMNVFASISGLYVSSGKLVVISSVWVDYNANRETPYPASTNISVSIPAHESDVMTLPEQFLVLFVFNLKDIEKPSFERFFAISGFLVTSRMQGNVVYALSQFYVWKDQSNGYALPELSDGSELKTIEVSSIHYDPDTKDAGYYMNIMAMDLSSLESKTITVIAGWASTIYMSPDSLYFTIVKWLVKWPYQPIMMMSADDAKILDSNDTITTTIYRVTVDDLTMRITAKGDVAGTLLNQFSMDERNGYLRIATTTSWVDQKNAVYILNPELQVIGSLEDLAPNERIYSTRFVGDTLYMVTFRQVDPLFVIDLSVPTEPRVLGETVLPGFSTYLHPVDQNHLLGIGRDGSSVKISLFDVSDPASPKEMSKYTLAGYSYSSAEYDHHSVLFDAEKELLVLPIFSYNYLPTYNYSTLDPANGFYVFKVSITDGISLRGIISHAQTNYWDNVQRALFIGNYLYTVWGSDISVNLLSDLSEVATLSFGNSTPGNIVYSLESTLKVVAPG